uniref:cytoplasmic dynein 2 intermediate chain 1 isoform X1 n=1 Tax=Vespula vulgaris TaxID=7454 RepID=UPI00223BD05E|nr:cytoplasmic dynein 2 intermediate chain 1 isoform X1 [Vespula vulgaris]
MSKKETTKVETHGYSKSQKPSSRRKADDEQLELPQTSSSGYVSRGSFKQKKPSFSQKEISINQQVSNKIVTSKSNNLKSLSTSNIVSNKTRDSSVKKSHLTHNTDTKPLKKHQSTYSEKRGLSTTYIPKSNLSGNSSKEKKEAVKKVTSKTISNNSASINKTDSQSKIRRNSRTLSSEEVKVLHSLMRKDNSKQELPKKREITTKVISKQKNIDQNKHDDNYYADDFEEYESDFEECTDDEILEASESSSENEINLYQSPIELSTKEQQKVVHNANNHKVEEEDMHDSGHYELAEAKRRAMIIETMITKGQNIPLPLSDLQQTINKEYSEDKLFENKSLPLSMDEGFEDTRSGDFTKLPSLSQVALIDFSKTKDNSNKKLTTTEKLTKLKSRGKQLLTMIKLNTLTFSLLECAPVPYEEFIRNYGKLHTQQMYTQTGDDKLEAETQTIEICNVNKWTQFPISCRNHRNDKGDVNLFIMEQAGVGSDDNVNLEEVMTKPSFDILQLNDFVRRAATVILSLLEEKKFGGTIFQNDVQEIPESDGFVKFDINSITFLAGREVTMINYSESLNKVLLTIHAPYEDDIETVHNQKDITDYCIGCVWNICEPSLPTKLFYSTSPITACCFHPTNYNIVFAGLEDGSISLWDLKENEIWHHKVANNINGNDWIIRMPTYTTTGNAEVSTHNSKIVAIRTLSKTEKVYTEMSKNKFIPIQLCSIDENGNFIIWSVFYNLESNVNDLGLSQWGNIRLIKSQDMSIQLNDNGTIIDMHIDNIDSNGVFVATDASEILHSTCLNCRVNPPIYKRHKIAPCGNTSCIEICPFKASYFLVGCNDGTILLYSSNREKPILQLQHDNYRNKITVLKWSRSKPSTVYVLNNKSQIYTCNLENNEMHYVSTSSLTKWGHINCMQLCSWKTERDKVTQYLVCNKAIIITSYASVIIVTTKIFQILGTNLGTVLVYKLKKESYCSEKAEFEKELHSFLNYITLL